MFKTQAVYFHDHSLAMQSSVESLVPLPMKPPNNINCLDSSTQSSCHEVMFKSSILPPKHRNTREICHTSSPFSAYFAHTSPSHDQFTLLMLTRKLCAFCEINRQYIYKLIDTQYLRARDYTITLSTLISYSSPQTWLPQLPIHLPRFHHLRLTLISLNQTLSVTWLVWGFGHTILNNVLPPIRLHQTILCLTNIQMLAVFRREIMEIFSRSIGLKEMAWRKEIC
jgi:hypothetical protein